jgi:hypothetical protein
MSRSADPRVFHVKYRDELKLLIIFIAVVVPALGVSNMLARGIDDSPLVDSVEALGEPMGLSHLVFGAALVGFGLAMVTLLYLDYQKRMQAVLLGTAAIGLTALLLFQLDRVIERAGVAVIAALAGGFVVGVITVGRHKLQYIQISDTSRMSSARTISGRGQKPLRFPLAERMLFWLVVLVIVVGFFEAHTDYKPLVQSISAVPDNNSYLTIVSSSSGDPILLIRGLENFSINSAGSSLLALDIVASSAFLVTMNWFLGYESNRSVFVLGPSGSGKTHLSIGMYVKAQELGFRPRNSTDELTRLVQRIIDEEDFIPERTRDVQDLSFEFTGGKYFLKDIQLDAFDYPGEYLPHIPGGLEVYYDELSQSDYQDLIRKQIDEGVAIEQGKGLVTQQDDGSVAADGGTGKPEDSPEQIRSDGENAGQTDAGGSTGTEDGAGAGGVSEAPTAAIDVGDDVIRERARIMTEEVCPRVAEADLLVMLVDVERLLNDVPLGTEWYSNILARLPDEQEAIIVATKADLLLPDAAGGELGDMIGQAERRDKVDRAVREHVGVGQLPISEKPYPVFYMTYEEDGERHIEMRNPVSADADLQRDVARKWPSLYGFKQLLRRLGR